MKQVDKMPTKGQFIIIFLDSGKLTADTLFYDYSNDLCSLSLGSKLGAMRINQIVTAPKEKQLKYFIAD